MKKYGKSPLEKFMKAAENIQLAHEAKSKLDARGKKIDRIPKLNQDQKIDLLPMGKVTNESVIVYDDATIAICNAFKVPIELLNTSEHSQTFIK